MPRESQRGCPVRFGAGGRRMADTARADTRASRWVALTASTGVTYNGNVALRLRDNILGIQKRVVLVQVQPDFRCA